MAEAIHNWQKKCFDPKNLTKKASAELVKMNTTSSDRGPGEAQESNKVNKLRQLVNEECAKDLLLEKLFLGEGTA